jgi:signal transduction histidine kinase
MTIEQSQREELDRLATHLASRRRTIVQRWCDVVKADPRLAKAAALPRSQFEDHVPMLLEDFEHCLRTHLDPDARQRSDAAKHGEQRWKSGYDLSDVTREWGHLHLLLVDELNAFERQHAGVSQRAMAAARHALAAFVNEGICESNGHYVRMQKSEADGELRDLERTVDEVRRLEQERGELIRQAAHDLRGNVGVISNATAALALANLADTKREAFLALLKRSVTSLHSMLDDVMDLARLQAGHESRDIKPFDAVALIRETCQSLEFLAAERGLYLRIDAPATLSVEGDATKTRRIAQNLVLNALRYTSKGGVTVRCAAEDGESGKRWILGVDDTGPGIAAAGDLNGFSDLQSRPKKTNPMTGTKSAGKSGSGEDLERDAFSGRDVATNAAGVDESAAPIVQERGEGVGLSIVKRLCELLDASINIDSREGAGTSFRVSFPRRYGRRAS